MLVESTRIILVYRFSFVSSFISRYMTDRIEENKTNLYTLYIQNEKKISILNTKKWWNKYETDNNKIESQNSFRKQQNYELLNDALELT